MLVRPVRDWVSDPAGQALQYPGCVCSKLSSPYVFSGHALHASVLTDAL